MVQGNTQQEELKEEAVGMRRMFCDWRIRRGGHWQVEHSPASLTQPHRQLDGVGKAGLSKSQRSSVFT